MKTRIFLCAVLAAALCLGAGGSRPRMASVPDEVPTPPPPPREEPFADVAFGQRWYDGAQYGYRNGLVRGLTETRFGGELTATRAMAATMLWRLAGRPEALGASMFRDMEPGRYYTAAVVWGESQGLWQGYGDGTFRPQEAVTRGQLELVLRRYCGEGSVGAAVLSRLPDPREEDRQKMTRGELAETLMELREERKKP